MLVFFAMFGVKKGSVIAYKSLWHFSFTDQIKSMLNRKNRLKTGYEVASVYTYRLLFTAITSRSTSYFLLLFWVFFFFFGESLLLLTFNYSTVSDALLSSSFFTVKQHTVFFLNSLSSYLEFSIQCFIFFLTSAAFGYLINCSYTSSYHYFRNSSVCSMAPYAVLLLLIVF